MSDSSRNTKWTMKEITNAVEEFLEEATDENEEIPKEEKQPDNTTSEVRERFSRFNGCVPSAEANKFRQIENFEQEAQDFCE